MAKDFLPVDITELTLNMALAQLLRRRALPADLERSTVTETIESHAERYQRQYAVKIT